MNNSYQNREVTTHNFYDNNANQRIYSYYNAQNPYQDTQINKASPPTAPTGISMNIAGGAPLGVFNMGRIPTISSNYVYNYNGNQILFNSELSEFNSNKLSTLKQIFLKVDGKMVEEPNTMLFVCVMVWACLIIPLIAMCFDCFWGSLYPRNQVTLHFYESLRIWTTSGVQNIVLIVNDNTFNSQKARILFEILSSMPNLRGFTFINKAYAINYKDNEFSNFAQNMKPIKNLNIISEIRWGRCIVN